MRSIIFKLTLAFLLVGLTGAILVALIIRQRTQTAFDQFVLSREQQSLVTNLLWYYEANGSWRGVAENIPLMIFIQSRNFDDRRDLQRDWARFTLAETDGRIVYSIAAEQIGQTLSGREREQAIILKVNGQAVGWLLLASQPRARVPNSPEDLFLKNVNGATLLSAGVAMLLALVLGSVLALTLTRSLRELRQATQELARGNLGLQVPVRSGDELGELAASFNQMSLDLQQATQARRQMTADIAHDLRSPLSVLTGYTEALSDGKLPGTPEIYGILHQETKHLGRLIDDLRTLSLADAGELPLMRQRVTPKLLLERVAARHAVTAQQQGLVLEAAVAADLPQVNVDVERMAQVLDNLILNAFRYTPAGGSIRLSAALAGGEVVLVVQDSGSGIAAADLPHIFDRFYRGDTARPHSGESGLGLAIARSIVAAHGGSLTVQSSPGEGTAFRISLPI